MSSEQQEQVFWAVVSAGALTTRRVIKEFGPKPNWQILIEQRRLKEYQTLYGAVLALGPQARADFKVRPAPGQYQPVPYIAGPSTVADRAYQNDALQTLLDRGYQLHHHDFKRSGKVDLAARTRRQYTDQILRTVVQVPPQQLRVLQHIWRGKLDVKGNNTYPHGVGYSFLYASVSNGGIKLPKLKALYRQHRSEIQARHSPLLIAVPEEGSLRPFIRGVETQERRMFEQASRNQGKDPAEYTPYIELIILPLPGTTG